MQPACDLRGPTVRDPLAIGVELSAPFAVVVTVETEVQPRAQLYAGVAEHLDAERPLTAVSHGRGHRAAEQAIPKTLGIVKQTVRDMSLEDVRGILSGGDDAATRFLRERAGGSLHDAILPIVAEATDKAGATSAYKALKTRADKSLGGLGGGLGGLGGLVDTNSLDLDSYVTGKTLDGLFLKLAAEEKAIRENPVARTTDLLKSVFGR